MQKKDDEQLMRKFSATRRRQHAAVAIAVVSVLLLAVISKRPDLLGQLQKKTILTWQLLTIWAFANFTAINWKCPSCKKYLGYDINKRTCNKCGARLR